MQLLIAAILVAAAPAPAGQAPASSPATISREELQLLFKKCAPTVAPETMAEVTRVESGGNPFAIGVVDGKLERQPQNLEEAVATAEALEKAGRNFSMGLVQVNRFNLARYGLTYRTAFDPCSNLRAGSKILEECYLRARDARHPDPLAAAVSCYYSGTFSRGFQAEPDGQASYVGLVLRRPDAPGATPPAQQPAPQKSNPVVEQSKDQPAAPAPTRAASPVVF